MTQVCVHSTNAKHLTHTLHCFGCWGFISERNKKTNKNLSSRRLINKKMREEDEADTLKAATPPGEEQSTGLLRLQSADLGRGAERHRGDEGGWGSIQHCCRRAPGVGSEWQSYLLQQETPRGKATWETAGRKSLSKHEAGKTVLFLFMGKQRLLFCLSPLFSRGPEK